MYLVQEKMLTALGAFVKKFSYLIDSPGHLRKMYLILLTREMQQREPSQRILTGIFTGLKFYCESIPFDIDKLKDKEYVDKLYVHIRGFLKPSKERIKIANRGKETHYTLFLTK